MLEPLQPEQVTVPSLWYSFPGLGTTPLSTTTAWAPEQAHTEAFQDKAAATPDTTTGHLCQRGMGASANEKCPPPSGFQGQQASPAPHCHQDIGIQALHSQIPVQRKGKKVLSPLLGSQSDMVHKRAQH